MGIKAVVTAEEHAALADALKPLYRQEGAVFVIDADGIDSHPATKSLKSALESERTGRSEITRQLNELKEKLGDMNPDEARDALKKIKDLEEAQRVGDIPEKFKQKFDEAVAARVESIQKNHATQVKGFERQITELQDKLKGANTQLENLTIDGEVRAVAAKKGLNEWAVEDAVMHARNMYRLVDGKPVPMKGDQIVYSGKKPGEAKPIDEWLEEKVQEKPGWLKPNSGSDTEQQRRRNGGGSQFTLTREQARNPEVYRQTKEAAKKAGQEVVIADV